MNRSPGWFTHVAQVSRTLPSARGLLPLIAALAIWQVCQPGDSPYFPPPLEWWNGLAALAKRGQLFPALAATTETLIFGLAAATIVASCLGVLIGTSARLSRAIGPLLEFLRAIPPPAVVPVAILFIGYDERMKFTVVFLAALWPILLNTASAAERIHPLLLDVASSFRLSAFDRLWRIVLPSVVPAVLLGVRVALPLAIVVTLLVEILTSINGIGALMIGAQRNFQSRQVYGLLVLIGLFGFAINFVFAAIEAAALRRWPPKHQPGL